MLIFSYVIIIKGQSVRVVLTLIAEERSHDQVQQDDSYRMNRVMRSNVDGSLLQVEDPEQLLRDRHRSMAELGR